MDTYNNPVLRQMILLANHGWKLFFATLTTVTLGAVSFGLLEATNAIDSVYWSVVTSHTVGFGDIAPKTDLGKIFVIFFCPLAFINMALVAAFLVTRLLLDQDKFTDKEQREIMERIELLSTNLLDEREQEGMKDSLARIEERLGIACE